MENEVFYFKINDAAKMVGVSPTTLRNWENSDLFVAKRNKNNYREYSLEDIEILKRIKELSINQNMNSAAIKNALDHGNNLSTPDIFSIHNSANEEVSSNYLTKKNWRKLREKRGLTLEEVSKQTGISISYLSKIESGNVNFSFDILTILSDYYEEPLLYYPEELFENKYPTYKDDRTPLDLGMSGVYVESLIKRKQTIMRPTFFTVLPKSGQHKSHTHNGEEFIYILQGEIVFTLHDSEEFILNAGDSISFKSSTPHRWENLTDRKANMIWVHSPLNPDTLTN